MFFLNSTALFALFAAAFPIIIHFFSAAKLKKIEFSSIRFLNEIQKSKIKKIQVKNLLLLFLRVLIITFIVLSFSRPALKSDYLSSISSASKTAAVIIIDDTYPMAISSEKGSAFNRAKKIAKEIVSLAKDGDYFSIATFSNQEKSLMFYSDKFLLERLIENLSITPAFKSIYPTIKNSIVEILKRPEINKDIFIISNFQKNKFDLKENILKDLTIDGAYLNLFLIDIETYVNQNLVIENLRLDSKILWANKKLEFSSLISNRGESTSSTIVELYLNDEPKSQKYLSLSPGTSEEIKLEASSQRKGYNFAKIKIQDDELNFDNERYLAFFIPNNLSVLLLAPEAEEVSYIKYAILASDTNAQIFIAKNSSDLNKINAQILSEDNKNFSSIILLGATNPEMTEFFLKSHRNGHGCIFIPTIKDDAKTIHELLKQAGISISVEKTEVSQHNAEIFGFDKINLEHPIFEEVFQKKKVDITSPKFLYYFRLSKSQFLSPIISLNDDSPYFSEVKFEKFGKFFIFATPINPAICDIVFKPIFAPLIFRTVLYASTSELKQYDAYVGHEISIVSDKPHSRYEILSPDNAKEIILPRKESTNIITYANANIPGFYSVKANDNIVTVFTTNINPSGSNLNKINFIEIKNKFEELKYIKNIKILSNEKNIKDEIISSRFGTELWPFFLIFAIILIYIEGIISRGSKKDYESIISLS